MKIIALIIACLIFADKAFADSPNPPTVAVKFKAEAYAGQSFNADEPSYIYAKVFDPLLSETVEEIYLSKAGEETAVQLKLFKNYGVEYGYKDENGEVTTRLSRNIKVRSNNQLVTLKVPGAALIEYRLKLSHYLPNRGKTDFTAYYCAQLTRQDSATPGVYNYTKCGLHELVFNVRPAVYTIKIYDPYAIEGGGNPGAGLD